MYLLKTRIASKTNRHIRKICIEVNFHLVYSNLKWLGVELGFLRAVYLKPHGRPHPFTYRRYIHCLILFIPQQRFSLSAYSGYIITVVFLWALFCYGEKISGQIEKNPRC